MQIFTQEFKTLTLSNLVCSWLGHKKGEWVEVYWAPAHSSEYKAKFCTVCNKQLETTTKPKWSAQP